jgi:hypothetical protein
VSSSISILNFGVSTEANMCNREMLVANYFPKIMARAMGYMQATSSGTQQRSLLD